MHSCVKAGRGNTIWNALQLSGRLQQPADAATLPDWLFTTDSFPWKPWILSSGHAKPSSALWIPAGETESQHLLPVALHLLSGHMPGQDGVL